MNPLFRGLVFRWIVRHRLRSALAVVAVALGVAAFLASVAVAQSVVATGSGVAASVGGGADLVVTAEETGLRTETVAKVAATPGVAAASGLIAQWLRAPDVESGRVLLLGADPAAEARLRRRGPSGAPVAPLVITDAAAALISPAVVSRPVADELRAAGHKTLRLAGVRGEMKFPLGAVAEIPDAARSVGGGRFVAFPLAVAQRVVGRDGLVDRIDVTLTDGADRDATAAAILAAIRDSAPPSVAVAPPGTPDASTQDLLGAADVGLKLGAIVALLVGVFLIHHTVSIGVTERRREVGILRALGATRGQVLAVFCGEAATLGLVGSGIGVLLGWVLATTSLQGFAGTIASTYFPAEPAPVEMSAALALSGIAAGVVTALIAAFGPARKAAWDAPDDAIRRGPEDAGAIGHVSRVRVVAALVLAAVAGVAVTLTQVKLAGYVAAVALLFSFVVAAPLLLAATARGLAPVLSRLCGIPGRLASDELSRHAHRAALPAAALAFGLALVVENLGVMTSLVNGTNAWMEGNVAGDLFVSSGGSAMKAGGHTLLDSRLRDDIRAVPGVRTLTGVRLVRIPWRGTRVLIIALDMDGYRPMARVNVGGAPTHEERDARLAEIGTGEACIVSENFVALHGIGPGDEVEIPVLDGEVRLRVVGTFPDYSWPRGTILLDRRVLEERLGDRVVDEFSLVLAPGASESDVRRGIEAAIGEGRDLVVLSGAELRREMHELLSNFFSLAYAQVAVALAVAFMGVLNSLWIAVMMRRREIGLLRAAGATRGQIVASIVIQAATLGFAGGLFGVVGGIAVQWIALRRVVFADTGWWTNFDIPWLACAAVVAGGVITSALAGWFPARSAARQGVAEAIGWE